MIFGENKLVYKVNLIKFEFLLLELLHLWIIHTISVDSECMTGALQLM